MKPLFTSEEFKKANSRDKLPCECYSCKSIFYKIKYDIQKSLSNTMHKSKFCSSKCMQTKQKVHCKHCNFEFLKLPNQIKKTKNHFCSRTCAGTYNALNKTHGQRRSKVETFLEESLSSKYPNLQIEYNKKTVIQSELDIYIPSLKIGFEINGIFHYKPIYGQEKFKKIQANDRLKKRLCEENKILLYTIDISKLNYFRSDRAQQYLTQVSNIIELHQ